MICGIVEDPGSKVLHDGAPERRSRCLLKEGERLVRYVERFSVLHAPVRTDGLNNLPSPDDVVFSDEVLGHLGEAERSVEPLEQGLGRGGGFLDLALQGRVAVGDLFPPRLKDLVFHLAAEA